MYAYVYIYISRLALILFLFCFVFFFAFSGFPLSKKKQHSYIVNSDSVWNCGRRDSSANSSLISLLLMWYTDS